MGALVTSMTEKDARVVSDFFTLAPKGEIPKAEVRRILTTLGHYPTLGPSHVAKLLIESGAAEIVQGDLGHEFVLRLLDRVLPGPVDPMAVQLQCKYCSETFQDKIQLMRHTRAAKHAFPVDRLKEILAGPQKTYDEIARELGLPHSTVGRWISVLKAQGAKDKHEEPQEPGSRTPKSGGVNPGPREEVKTRVDQLEAENVQLKEALKESEEKIRTLTDALGAKALIRSDGILRSRIEIAFFDGYYDAQRKLITESIKEEIYHAAKGRSIVMESRALDGDARRIIIEISGGEQL